MSGKYLLQRGGYGEDTWLGWLWKDQVAVLREWDPLSSHRESYSLNPSYKENEGDAKGYQASWGGKTGVNDVVQQSSVEERG